MSSDHATRPQGVTLHRKSRTLELQWPGEAPVSLSCEFLRVHSPSAEVRGHGHGQEVLVAGKREVSINSIHPVGHYALQLVFDDGHDTGLYSWGYLRELCREREQRWESYLERLDAAGLSRDPDTQVLQFAPGA